MPPVDDGMNKTRPNNAAIQGRGADVGPKIDADPDKKKGSAAKDQKILDRIVKRTTRCIEGSAGLRKQMVEDRKFWLGDQWSADVMAQRATDKRPCETVNQMKTFVHQVTNPVRENRPALRVSPIGSRADKEAAKMFAGMIKSIERDSHADIAYDTALSSAVASGLGYFRLALEWRAENSFDQVLVIKRIRNPFTIYLDPDCLEPDGSDARFGIETEIIPEDEFKEDYPHAQLMPFAAGGAGEKYRNWTTKDGVRVAQYYEIVEEPAELVSLSTGWTGWREDVDEVTARRIKTGAVDILQSRESHKRKVMYYKVTALEILERSEWVGKWIPIIPVIGEEIDVEGKTDLSGIIRDAKGPQRRLNYLVTSELELAALVPKSPYIMEEGQLEGHEQEWKNANTKIIPVLTYKGTSVDGHQAPPPQRALGAQVSSGISEAKAAAAQDMMATTGIRFDATLRERMNDESGKAIRELSRHSDIGSFHFIDNLRRSLEFLGKQIVDAIPKVYTEKQVLTILREDDTLQNITIDPMMGQAYKEVQTPKGLMRYFNPTFGEYGVTVDIGPSYATKRIEAAESMMEFVKALPNTAQLVMDLIASEMDWPGADKIAARLAKAVPAQLLTADLKDIPPQIQALIQNLEQQSKALQAQLQQAMKALQDKQADRDVKLEAISAQLEGKLIPALMKSDDQMQKLAVEQARTIAMTIIEDNRAHQDRMHDHDMLEHQHETSVDMLERQPPEKESNDHG